MPVDGLTTKREIAPSAAPYAPAEPMAVTPNHGRRGYKKFFSQLSFSDRRTTRIRMPAKP